MPGEADVGPRDVGKFPINTPLDFVRILYFSFCTSIENACTKQGVSRSAWLRTVLQQVLSVDDAGTVEEEDSETSTRKIRKF